MMPVHDLGGWWTGMQSSTVPLSRFFEYPRACRGFPRCAARFLHRAGGL
jgi:hypothetical protein